MHLIVRDFPDDLVDMLKQKTGNVAATKAVTSACHQYVAQLRQLEEMRALIRELETAVQVQRQVIHGARSAAAVLLEHTSQGDLLTSV